jgi:two-component system, NtrC family, response regulator AtoC
VPVDPNSYLLRFSGAAARLLRLPTQGSVALGPGCEELEPCNKEALALVTTGSGLSTIEAESGSTHVRVNGEQLQGPRRLLSGDVVILDDESALYLCDPRSPAEPGILRARALCGRLAEEVERARRYGRVLALLTVQVDALSVELEDLGDLVAASVRGVDIVGFNRSGEIVVILPETGEAAEVPARRLLETTQPHAAVVRIGIARVPEDGDEADALLTASRLAARRAAPGEIGQLSPDDLLIDVGDQQVVAADPRTRWVFSLLDDLARSEVPVLITGETGVGKEVAARAIHAWSRRREGPLVCINCAAFSETLLESELFGHERGAFTGAVSRKIGLLESAAGGTVFLDEISESSPRAQAELLRVLETKRIRPVGAVEEREVDVRVVAATNREIEEEVAQGRFRKDLYYRLNAAMVELPALRDRPADVLPLARRMLEQACRRAERPTMRITPEALRRLQAYDWPGNVRELKNLMEQLEALVRAPVVEEGHLPERISPSRLNLWGRPLQHAAPGAPTPEGGALTFPKLSAEVKELERTRMQQALKAAGGVRVRAAELIGMPLRTFVTKLKVYGLTSPRAEGDGGQVSAQRR